MIPCPGETGAAWSSNTGSGAERRDYLASIGVSPTDADDDVVVYYHDVPSEVVRVATHRAGSKQSWTPMEQPWPLVAWPNVPTRVLIGRHDRMFPARFQRRIARERLGIDGDEIDGGHMLALSRPGELAERLEAYRMQLSY
jgi:pimeloyl-ACP methyl ester carboxylesterase